MTDIELIKVGKSTIKNAGNGAFATRDISQGTIICEYDGQVMTKAEYENATLYQRDRIAKINEDAFVFNDSLASMVNDNIDMNSFSIKFCDDRFNVAYQKAKRENGEFVDYNCSFFKCQDKILIIAIKDIRRDEELFISYGAYYWLSRFWGMLQESMKKILEQSKAIV